MDIISRVLAWHTTGNLIITDGPCLLGHRVNIKLFHCTVLMDFLIGMTITLSMQHITTNLIVTVGPYLATGTMSEEKADS